MPGLSYVHHLFNADQCHASIHTLRWKDRGYVTNFAQEVVKGQIPLSVEGIRQPGSRTVRPQ
jgi:hypothetical protein